MKFLSWGYPVWAKLLMAGNAICIAAIPVFARLPIPPLKKPAVLTLVQKVFSSKHKLSAEADDVA